MLMPYVNPWKEKRRIEQERASLEQERIRLEDKPDPDAAYRRGLPARQVAAAKRQANREAAPAARKQAISDLFPFSGGIANFRIKLKQVADNFNAAKARRLEADKRDADAAKAYADRQNARAAAAAKVISDKKAAAAKVISDKKAAAYKAAAPARIAKARQALDAKFDSQYAALGPKPSAWTQVSYRNGRNRDGSIRWSYKRAPNSNAIKNWNYARAKITRNRDAANVNFNINHSLIPKNFIDSARREAGKSHGVDILGRAQQKWDAFKATSEKKRQSSIKNAQSAAIKAREKSAVDLKKQHSANVDSQKYKHNQDRAKVAASLDVVNMQLSGLTMSGDLKAPKRSTAGIRLLAGLSPAAAIKQSSKEIEYLDAHSNFAGDVKTRLLSESIKKEYLDYKSGNHYGHTPQSSSPHPYATTGPVYLSDPTIPSSTTLKPETLKLIAKYQRFKYGLDVNAPVSSDGKLRDVPKVPRHMMQKDQGKSYYALWDNPQTKTAMNFLTGAMMSPGPFSYMDHVPRTVSKNENQKYLNPSKSIPTSDLEAIDNFRNQYKSTAPISASTIEGILYQQGIDLTIEGRQYIDAITAKPTTSSYTRTARYANPETGDWFDSTTGKGSVPFAESLGFEFVESTRSPIVGYENPETGEWFNTWTDKGAVSYPQTLGLEKKPLRKKNTKTTNDNNPDFFLFSDDVNKEVGKGFTWMESNVISPFNNFIKSNTNSELLLKNYNKNRNKNINQADYEQRYWEKQMGISSDIAHIPNSDQFLKRVTMSEAMMEMGFMGVGRALLPLKNPLPAKFNFPSKLDFGTNTRAAKKIAAATREFDIIDNWMPKVSKTKPIWHHVKHTVPTVKTIKPIKSKNTVKKVTKDHYLISRGTENNPANIPYTLLDFGKKTVKNVKPTSPKTTTTTKNTDSIKIFGDIDPINFYKFGLEKTGKFRLQQKGKLTSEQAVSLKENEGYIKPVVDVDKYYLDDFISFAKQSMKKPKYDKFGRSKFDKRSILDKPPKKKSTKRIFETEMLGFESSPKGSVGLIDVGSKNFDKFVKRIDLDQDLSIKSSKSSKNTSLPFEFADDGLGFAGSIGKSTAARKTVSKSTKSVEQVKDDFIRQAKSAAATGNNDGWDGWAVLGEMHTARIDAKKNQQSKSTGKNNYGSSKNMYGSSRNLYGSSRARPSIIKPNDITVERLKYKAGLPNSYKSPDPLAHIPSIIKPNEITQARLVDEQKVKRHTVSDFYMDTPQKIKSKSTTKTIPHTKESLYLDSDVTPKTKRGRRAVTDFYMDTPTKTKSKTKSKTIPRAVTDFYMDTPQKTKTGTKTIPFFDTPTILDTPPKPPTTKGILAPPPFIFHDPFVHLEEEEKTRKGRKKKTVLRGWVVPDRPFIPYNLGEFYDHTTVKKSWRKADKKGRSYKKKSRK